MNRYKGFGALFLAAILYAVNDILIRIIGTQLTTFQQLTFRSIVGVVIILSIIGITKSSWNTKKLSKINLILYALSFPITVILFTLAILNGKVASAVFAFYAGSFLFSFLIEMFFFKERITGKKIIGLFLVLLGLFYFTYPFGPQDVNIGFFYGLFASSIMILTNSMNKHIGGKIHYGVLTFLQMTAGIIVGSLAIIITHQTFFPAVTALMILIIIVSGSLLMSVVFLAAYGFKHFDLHLGTIVTSMELFFAPLFAFFIFQEKLSINQILGGLLIASAIATSQIILKKK